MAKENSMRSQLKATSIKSLRKRVDEDNNILGASGSNEYLNLEDGKTLKIRIFPAHPGQDDFYVPQKCYWLSYLNDEGEVKRMRVNDSVVHGGTKLDVVAEYVKWAKKKCSGDSTKIDAINGRDGLSPSYSWLCYAAVASKDEQMRAKVWEFKKQVRDALNKLAMSEDEEDVIEVDPFTDPDEGMPVFVKYLKNPNKKKGENFYDVSLGKKPAALPLSDEEIEYFMSLKPLSEVIPTYGITDFERALQGLQYFDEENEIGLFDDDDWMEHVEEIKSQYDAQESEDEPKRKTVKKSSKKQEDEDDDEEESKPAKKTAKKSKKVEPEPEEDDEEEEEEDEDNGEDTADGDEFDRMDRNELKKYIRENELEVSVKKSMDDDAIREAIRAAEKDASEADEEDDDEDDDEDDAPAKVTLEDIKRKLGKK